MKKVLAIAISVIMLLSFAAPVMAEDIDTEVTVQTGTGGNAPIVKCKWEGPDSGDPGHVIPMTQINPPVSFGGTVNVAFWAVVTDPEGLLNVANVYTDVYHPLGPPFEGSFKYQVQLTPWDNALADDVLSPAEINSAVAEINFAYNAGLITFASPYTIDEVIEEIVEGTAWLWRGVYVLDYHQPYGCYGVEAYAFDKVTNNKSIILENCLDYLPVTAAEYDFTSINYGDVIVSSEKMIDGNLVWGDNIATVRNIGNTWFHLEIRQDDMGFGMTATDWNVEFDARLGNALENEKIVFDPAYAEGTTPPSDQWTIIPGKVHLCNTWKLDFSIHVKKASETIYSGLMELRAVFNQFEGPNIEHPEV